MWPCIIAEQFAICLSAVCILSIDCSHRRGGVTDVEALQCIVAPVVRCRGEYQIPNWDCWLYVVTDRLTLIGIAYM